MVDIPPFPASASWAIAAAVGAASLTIIAKIIETWASKASDRKHDRRAVAAAISGEMAGYIRGLDPERLVDNLGRWKLAAPDALLKILRALPPLPTSHPVYDKLAEKTGVLPPHVARDIALFYNAVTGFRLIYSSFSSQAFAEAGDVFQKEMIEQVRTIVQMYIVPARGTVAQMDRIWSGRAQDIYNQPQTLPPNPPVSTPGDRGTKQAS